MKSTLKKIGVILVTYVLSHIVAMTIAFGIGTFIFSDETFINLMSGALLIIAFCVLYKPIKKLILKEGEISAKNAKNSVYIVLTISVILGIICICKVNRTFASGYDKLMEDIQMANEQCPIKGEDSELTSVKLQSNTLVYTYLFYEYREQTVEVLRENEKVLRENILYSIMNDKEMFEQIKNNNINVSIVYVGNRSNEKVEFTITVKELNQISVK